MHRRETRPQHGKTTTRYGEFGKSNRSISPGTGIHFQQESDGNIEDHAALVGKISLLERDLERRQESYVTRERAYKLRIEELEEELSNQRSEKTGYWLICKPVIFT